MFPSAMRSQSIFGVGLVLLAVACSTRRFSHHEQASAGASSDAGATGESESGGTRNGNGGRDGAPDATAGASDEDSGAAENGGAPGGTSGTGGANGGSESTTGGAANAAGTATGGNGASAGAVAAGGAGGSAGSGASAASGGQLGSGGRGVAGDGAAAGAGVGGQPVVGGCDDQLLTNADFEAGPGSPWQESSDAAAVEVVVSNDDSGLQAQGVAAHGGRYLAWLGGVSDNPYDSHQIMLSQSVTIPADASDLTFSAEVFVKSEEQASAVYDVAYVQLEDADDNVLWLALTLTNQDVGDDWQHVSVDTQELDAIRGQTLNFVAYSRTDPMGVTSFFLDDLELTAACSR